MRLINMVMADTTVADITVGAGATLLGYTDRYPATVVKVCTPRKIVVKMDKFEPYCSMTQDYTYTQDDSGIDIILRKHKDGRWYDKHKGVWSVGRRERYYDFSF